MRFAVWILCAGALFCSCSKEPSPSSLIRGKLVRSSCVDPVVQILDSNYYHLGQAWYFSTATNPDASFNHVFTVNNACDFTKVPLNEGDEFYFYLSGPSAFSCAACDLLLEAPQKRINIKVKK